jgi:hypothetical protein
MGMRFCINCGGEVAEGDRFCTHCANPLSVSVAPSRKGMTSGQIVAMLVATWILCWLLIPILGVLMLGGGASGAVSGCSILLIWPLTMFFWHRNVTGSKPKAA